MSCFTHITLNWSTGDFPEQFREAKGIAEKTGLKVSFSFNGVSVNITKHSSKEKVWEKYREARHGQQESCFGEGW